MNSPAETAELPPIEKMTFSTKFAYGAGDIGGAIVGILLLSYLSPFFTDVVHLSPGLAGATQLVVRVWDACIDPVIGIMSDRGNVFGTKIREKWGRRYPWMLFSAIPFGILFICQWLIPFPATNQWGLFVFYTLVSMLLGTFFTTYSLPYTALTAELTEDYNERTSLNSFRFTFSLGGSIAALLIARTVFQQVSDPAQQYLTIGIICAIISVVQFFTVSGARKQEQNSSISIKPPELRIPIRYRSQINCDRYLPIGRLCLLSVSICVLGLACNLLLQLFLTLLLVGWAYNKQILP